VKVDALLTNAKFYDVTRFDIATGEKFSLMVYDFPSEYRIFSDNDPALSFTVTGSGADVSADKVGTSFIQIQNASKEIVKELIISVVDAIIPQATKLGLTADAPTQK
jgi:hypothetical protein